MNPEKKNDIIEAIKQNTSEITCALTMDVNTANEIAEALKANTALQSIHFMNSKIHARGLQILLNALIKKPNLARISFQNIQFKMLSTETEGFNYLAEFLRNHPSIEELDISDMNLSDGKLTPIANALKQNNVLKRLILSWNQMDSAGIIALAGALENHESLFELCLSENWPMQDDGVCALAKLIDKNQVFKSLKFSANAISLKNASDLARALRKNHRLQFFNMVIVTVDPKGFAKLTEGLNQNGTLKYFGIQRPYFGTEIRQTTAITMGKAITEALKKNTQLESLNLANLSLRDAGVEFLATYLNSTSSLRNLYLQHNNITNPGLRALAAAIQNNRSLRQLNLNGNYIAQEGVEILEQALLENTSIVSLTCDTAMPGCLFQDKITPLLNRNKIIERFYDVLKILSTVPSPIQSDAELKTQQQNLQTAFACLQGCNGDFKNKIAHAFFAYQIEANMLEGKLVASLKCYLKYRNTGEPADAKVLAQLASALYGGLHCKDSNFEYNTNLARQVFVFNSIEDKIKAVIALLASSPDSNEARQTFNAMCRHLDTQDSMLLSQEMKTFLSKYVQKQGIDDEMAQYIKNIAQKSLDGLLNFVKNVNSLSESQSTLFYMSDANQAEETNTPIEEPALKKRRL